MSQNLELLQWVVLYNRSNSMVLFNQSQNLLTIKRSVENNLCPQCNRPLNDGFISQDYFRLLSESLDTAQGYFNKFFVQECQLGRYFRY